MRKFKLAFELWSGDLKVDFGRIPFVIGNTPLNIRCRRGPTDTLGKVQTERVERPETGLFIAKEGKEMA